jgi:predicted Fe-Mo cluster-binding NifX family protein
LKVAVAAEKDSEESPISPKGGRAPYYLIFEDGVVTKKIRNPFAVGGGGAGFGVAQMLANEGVNLVIGGRFGGNMKMALEEKGMKFREAEGKVKDSL